MSERLMHGERRGRVVWDAALRQWVPVRMPTPRAAIRRRQRDTTSKQRQRARAEANGLCPTCCAREATPPYRTCEACRDRGAKRFRELHRLATLATRAGLG